MYTKCNFVWTQALFVWSVLSQAPKTVSIIGEPDYAIQPQCVQECLWSSNGYWVGGQIGCGSPYYNACYCNANFVSTIVPYVSSCASKLCDNDAQASTAVAIFVSYCSQAGFPLPSLGVVVTTTTSQGVLPSTAAVSPNSPTSTQLEPPTLSSLGYSSSWSSHLLSGQATSFINPSVSPTLTGSSPSNPVPPVSSDSSSSNNGTTVQIIAIVIPTIAVLVAVVAIAFFYFRWKKGQRDIVLEISGGGLPPSY